jgi:hypothetical protein
MRRSTFNVVLSAVLAAASCGCQREPTFEYAPVSGKVTKNGAPLAGIRVMFYADHEAGTRGPRALGRTNAAGEYQLTTDAGVSGAVVGTHRVCLLPPSRGIQRFVESRSEKDAAQFEKVLGKLPKGEGAGQEGPVPAEFSDMAKTPLHAAVHSGSQTIDFEVP